MKRFAALATVLFLSSPPSWAADTQQDVQAQLLKMQEAQARLMSAMMAEKQSRLGFNETVAALQEAARKRGWEIGQVMDMQAIMLKAGHKDAKPFKVLSMCKRELAESLLRTQAAHNVMPFAPCRINVFEDGDRKVYVAKPNTELMAQMAMPVFVPLLQQMVAEEDAVLASVAK